MACRPENAVARGIFPRAASGTRMLPPVAPARHVLPLADGPLRQACCVRCSSSRASVRLRLSRVRPNCEASRIYLRRQRAAGLRSRDAGKGPSVGQELARVVEEDDAVAQQAPPLLGVANDAKCLGAVRPVGWGAWGPVRTHVVARGSGTIRFTVVSLAGRRVALRPMLESGLTGDCSGSHDRPPLRASPEGAQRRGSSGGRTPPPIGSAGRVALLGAADALRGAAAACPHLRADRIDFHLGLQPSGHDTGRCGHAGAGREREDAQEPMASAARPSALARTMSGSRGPAGSSSCRGRARWVLGRSAWIRFTIVSSASRRVPGGGRREAGRRPGLALRGTLYIAATVVVTRKCTSRGNLVPPGAGTKVPSRSGCAGRVRGSGRAGASGPAASSRNTSSSRAAGCSASPGTAAERHRLLARQRQRAGRPPTWKA